MGEFIYGFNSHWGFHANAAICNVDVHLLIYRYSCRDYLVCDYKPFPRLIMAEIEIKNLHKSFGDFIAVKNSNLIIENSRHNYTKDYIKLTKSFYLKM